MSKEEAKQLIYFLLLIPLILFISGCSKSSEHEHETPVPQEQVVHNKKIDMAFNPNDVVDNRVYVVATEAKYPPFEELGGKDSVELLGFDIDLIKAVAKNAGIKIRIIDTPWSEFVPSLNNGTRDIWISAIAIKENRKKLVTYTNPYFSTYTIAMVRDTPENKSITKFSDLRNKVVATQSGTVNYDEIARMQQGGSGHIISTKTQFIAFKDLLIGKADAVVGDVNVMRSFAKNYPQYKLRAFPIANTDEGVIPLGIVVRKDNQQLAKRLNYGLAGVIRDGTMQYLEDKWFGKTNNQ